MALIQLGNGIANISGSVAGNTYSHNRYGRYIRNRSIPVNPNTDRQQNARAALAVLVERWAETLTIAQRAAWSQYADGVTMLNRLSESIHLSGMNHYIRSNAQLAKQGYTIVDAGPVLFTIPDHDPALALAASEGTQQWTITYDDTLAWDNETGGYMFFSQGMPQNGQRNFFGGPLRNQGEIAGVTGAPIASPYVGSISWAIAQGQHLWLSVRILRADGRISTPFRADCIVGA